MYSIDSTYTLSVFASERLSFQRKGLKGKNVNSKYNCNQVNLAIVHRTFDCEQMAVSKVEPIPILQLEVPRTPSSIQQDDQSASKVRIASAESHEVSPPGVIPQCPSNDQEGIQITLKTPKGINSQNKVAPIPTIDLHCQDSNKENNIKEQAIHQQEQGKLLLHVFVGQNLKMLIFYQNAKPLL